ncbi:MULTISPECIES: carboxymuconolactone decarboxylase family protein [unclassified Arcicella]|uniref:carboxymuconolactone decarboxylase family protein n=1 Tax=unclassified Arcicella TaxID=2644986 RepID=UPI00286567BD|nr:MULTISPECIES: carboxymuconolactone decarboxylase family protein [unclassified Arcicella]MDR6560220.1 AhpD family alkylhydroperoxidase [Arcicella sp. BE51]MDR6810174.1 AhpD family alkylhydroperoxidase [Arcicella sp. BE140]MDR6821523.1 AhpD family alkylhydroperoxidase [Arcicella sp. BE139]
MDNRINILQTEPEAYKALLGIDKYLQGTTLTNTHKELIKIRASQINGCAFCINMHTKDARKYGETEQRIYLLNAWKETTLFTEEEKAILALTEEITLISQSGVSDATYQKARELFDENYLSNIIVAIIGINAWNRVAVTTRLQPA